MIIDGKAIAAGLYDQMRQEVTDLEARYGRRPGLWAVIVGEDPASQVYVRNKENAARKVGLAGEVLRLPSSTTQEELLAVLGDLNADERVDGILLQLPLPPQIDKDAAIAAIAPSKDVDGYAGMKQGLTARQGCIAPCTPRACIHLIKSTGMEIEGKHALVVGRGELVGKPVAALLLNENATVTILGKKYNCWKVESTPVKKDVEFTYRYIWVDKESYLPMRIEFYDRKGMYKEWETLGYRYVKGADGRVTYVLRNGTEIHNVRTGHGTRCTVTKFEFDNAKNVKAEYFTTNWLNTGKF